jgi:hypothetical protein
VPPFFTGGKLDALKYEGNAVLIAGKEYVIPSLSTKDAKRLWPDFTQLNKGVDVESMPKRYDVLQDILYSALSRNYPELTLDEVGDLVSVSELLKLAVIVAQQSGFVKRPGEGPVAAVENPSIGLESTDALSREPAGPLNNSTTQA